MLFESGHTSAYTYRVTDSNDNVISMLAGFRRHLVGKTLRNILH